MFFLLVCKRCCYPGAGDESSFWMHLLFSSICLCCSRSSSVMVFFWWFTRFVQATGVGLRWGTSADSCSRVLKLSMCLFLCEIWMCVGYGRDFMSLWGAMNTSLHLLISVMVVMTRLPCFGGKILKSILIFLSFDMPVVSQCAIVKKFTFYTIWSTMINKCSELSVPICLAIQVHRPMVVFTRDGEVF